MSTKKEKRVQALAGKYADSDGKILGPRRCARSSIDEFGVETFARRVCNRKNCATCKQALKPGCTLKLLATQDKLEKNKKRKERAKLDKELGRNEWEYIIL